MFKLNMLLLCLIFSMNCSAQIPAPTGRDCGFFKKLNFKNGIDTITFKASFQEIDRFAGSDHLNQLLKEKKIKKSNFDYQIAFKPEGCSEIYFCPSSEEKINSMLKRLGVNPNIYITCMVFDRIDWYYNGVPFFVVIKVVTTNK